MLHVKKKAMDLVYLYDINLKKWWKFYFLEIMCEFHRGIL